MLQRNIQSSVMENNGAGGSWPLRRYILGWMNVGENMHLDKMIELERL